MSASRLSNIAIVIAMTGLLMAPAVSSAARSSPTVTELVPGSILHGGAGVAVADDGTLYVISFHGRSIYHLDPVTGKTNVILGPPLGEGDDIAIGPKGTPTEGVLAWTTSESVNVLRPGGQAEVLMDRALRANPIAFDKDGRLFFAQSGSTSNELWELDALGKTPPRLVLKSPGPLNGFGFGPDGRLYSPLFNTDQAVAINVATGTVTNIAKGLGSPASVKPDKEGNLFSVDYKRGDIWRVDGTSGDVTLLTTLKPPLDNLAVAPDGSLYVTSPADSSVFTVDPKTGGAKKLIDGRLNTPLGLAMTTRAGKPYLIAGQPMGFVYLNPTTGESDRPPWDMARNGSFAIAADDTTIVTLFNDRLRKIDRASDSITLESREVKTPTGVAILASGQIFITDMKEGTLLKWTDNGVTRVAEGLLQPTAIAVESPTSVLIAETGAGRISSVNLSTGKRTTMARGLDRPQGVVKLLDGRIAFAEPARGVIAAVDSKGKRSELASGLHLSSNGLRVPQMAPIGLAVGNDGSLYVACPGNNSVMKIDLVNVR